MTISDFPFQGRPREPFTATCPRHGSYTSPANKPACPECRQNADETKEQWQDACWIWSTWQRAGIPARFKNRRLHTYRPRTKSQQSALDAVRHLTRGKLRALALLGAVGTGKTHLSVAAVAAAIRHPVTARWWTAADLFRQWRATFKREADTSEADFLEAIDQTELLVIDEIGPTRLTDWESGALTEIVDRRYREDQSILITSNCASLADALGDRAADRFAEFGIAIVLDGASYRQQAADDPALAIPDDFEEPPRELEWLEFDGVSDQIKRIARPATTTGAIR